MIGTVIITGATRGIGRAAVETLLARRPDTELMVLARGDGGRSLVDDLRRTGASATWIETDLLSLTSVAQATGTITARLDSGALPPLRALVGNAGLQYTNNVTETAEGFEATFAINVLANHVLIRGLQDHLPAGSRIVITVSDTHFGDLRHNLGMVPGPQWHDPDVLARPGAFANPRSTTAGRRAYATSKLAAIYLVHEHARRLPSGVDIVGFNPGFVPGTSLTRDAGALSRVAMRWLMPLLTLTPLATTPAAAGRGLAETVTGSTAAQTGAYIDRDHVARSSEESYHPEREHMLWDAVEQLAVGFIPPSL